MVRRLILLVAAILACSIDYQHHGKRSCWSWTCAYDTGGITRCVLPEDEPAAGVAAAPAPPPVPVAAARRGP